jgi:hypothetical protein
MVLICKKCNGAGKKLKTELIHKHSFPVYPRDYRSYSAGPCKLCNGNSWYYVNWVDLVLEYPDLYNKKIYRLEEDEMSVL